MADASGARRCPLDNRIAQVSAVLQDIDERFLKQQLAEVPNDETFDINEFVSGLIERVYKKKKVEEPEGVSPMSALQRSKEVKVQEVVEELWKEESLGKKDLRLAIFEPDADILGSAAAAYCLHALHTLLDRHPKVPAEQVRKIFSKDKSFTRAGAKLKKQRRSLETRQTERKSAPVPSCEVPIALVYEIALVDKIIALEDINVALEQCRAERKKKVEFAKAARFGLWTCGICCEEELLEEQVEFCSEGIHSFCQPCVHKHAMPFFGNGLFTLNFHELAKGKSSSSSSSSAEVVDLQAGARLACQATSGCSGCFRDPALRRSLSTKEYQRLGRRVAGLEALAAGVGHLALCPNCDYMVEMHAQGDGLLHCLSPDCQLVSCRACGKPDHRPLRCDEVEEDAEVKFRTFMEEKKTELLARSCPGCKKLYERIDGCNKMVCKTCNQHFCYLCGEKIGSSYDHFKDGSIGGGSNNSASRCVVEGTPAWAMKQGKDDKDLLESALQAYLDKHPELSELGEERINKVRRLVNDVPEPTQKRSRRRT